ncbi:M15 family metallopeptidase [Hymenobacter mucosus]|uniref:D-alanyl-D-alanine dipeptidase n=1 Tax=Hymenobacter mucosus TaxID=1411120 RepID=A0A238W0N9_9BACT|nr:M15 family metallopeptidase [Hymenobacter mucosus]SNR39279.1 D-alanyl-D-alanine dipeptidase [Hymenobacter mucosus]
MSASSSGPYVLSSPEQYWQLVQAQTEQELVDLASYVPGLVLDIRYATSHNVLGKPMYSKPLAYARRPVAEALAEVQQELQTRGLGLCVYDAYRPYSVTVRLFEHIQDENFAAPPSRGSHHNRGCSVDVGLVELATGCHLPMPTDFDELGPPAHARYSQLPGHIILNRCLLLASMCRHGFVNYPGEWWHFDYHSWDAYDLLDLSFENLTSK